MIQFLNIVISYYVNSKSVYIIFQSQLPLPNSKHSFVCTQTEYLCQMFRSFVSFLILFRQISFSFLSDLASPIRIGHFGKFNSGLIQKNSALRPRRTSPCFRSLGFYVHHIILLDEFDRQHLLFMHRIFMFTFFSALTAREYLRYIIFSKFLAHLLNYSFQITNIDVECQNMLEPRSQKIY